MFSAIVVTQLVAVNSAGRGIPVANEKRESLGTQFPDRASAIQACEAHFSIFKQALQNATPDNPLISQSTLHWEGNSASPEIPLAVRPMPNSYILSLRTRSVRKHR